MTIPDRNYNFRINLLCYRPIVSVHLKWSTTRAIKTSFAYRAENAFVYASIKKQNFNSMRINRLTTITGLLIRVLNTGLVAAILALGIYGLSVQSVSPGEFVAGVTLASAMAADVGWFVSIWEGLTQSLGAIKDARPTIDPRPKITAPVDDAGRFEKAPVIELSKVAFAYGDGSPTILRDIQLEIQPRLSTIRDFDRIVVLDAGRISAVGTHDDLLRDNPLYHDLWEKQAGQTTPHQFGQT